MGERRSPETLQASREANERREAHDRVAVVPARGDPHGGVGRVEDRETDVCEGGKKVTINELCESLQYGERLKVLSARTGRMLIENAVKSEKQKAFGEMHVWGIHAVVIVSKDGSYAHPALVCWCGEDEYNRFKKEGKK